MFSLPHPYYGNNILDAPKHQVVCSVAMLSCVDILQGDEEDVVRRPGKHITSFDLKTQIVWTGDECHHGRDKKS